MDHDPPSFWRSRAGLALLVACAVIGFYLLTEHTAHLLGALPFLLVLACPLMHVFMHRGAGHHHGSPRSTNDEQRRQ
jgi:hypothetical protein